MSLTIFSKHDVNTRASISYAEFAWFRTAFACAYDDAIGECYEGYFKNRDLANYYDQKFEEIFKAAPLKKKNVMKFLCKSDCKGSVGKAILQVILGKKEEIINNAEKYQRKPFELIFSVLEKAKDYGIRWA